MAVTLPAPSRTRQGRKSFRKYEPLFHSWGLNLRCSGPDSGGVPKMSEWSPHYKVRSEAKGRIPSQALTVWGLIVLTGIFVTVCLSLLKQDESAREIAELKYRMQAMERRPAKLSESDRATISDQTQAQVNRALLSRR